VGGRALTVAVNCVIIMYISILIWLEWLSFI